ncbi:MAG: hypothetical protein H6722_30785 [Sandaracinus sp.]|nr:hypothetical protein [Sandaracinus sp.]
MSTPPILTIPADVTIPFGTPVMLTALATDDDEGSLTSDIEWADLATNHFAPVGTVGGAFAFTPNAIGRHPVRVRVQDAYGVMVEDEVLVTVTGSVTQHDPVQMIIEPGTGRGITLRADQLAMRYSEGPKWSVLSNQALYGEFWYFEAHRLSSQFYFTGVGLTVHDGDFDPYHFEDPPWSMSINTGGDTWRNLISRSTWTNTNDRYGFAVDYRGPNPIVHVIIGGVLQSTQVMDDTWVPVHPFAYGGPALSSAPDFDMEVNFGATPFFYDPVAILSAAGVDASALEVGWGDANTTP